MEITEQIHLRHLSNKELDVLQCISHGFNTVEKIAKAASLTKKEAKQILEKLVEEELVGKR